MGIRNPHAIDNFGPSHSGAPYVKEIKPVLDPCEVARRLAHLPHLIFFDSADSETPSLINRYSFVAADPVTWLCQRNLSAFDGFDQLAALAARFQVKSIPELPPFQGGIAGLLGYELSHCVEQFAMPRFDDFHIPDLAVGIYGWVLAWDHFTDQCWMIGHCLGDHKSETQKFLSVVDLIQLEPQSLPQYVENPPKTIDRDRWHPINQYRGVLSNFKRSEFETAIERAVRYTHAGDCFQVNLSQRLIAPFNEHPFGLYKRLRKRNPAPFAAYLGLGDFAVASASPERFLSVTSAGSVTARPIKGTRPRGIDPEDDARLCEELCNSEKDRAENVMIVDLLRNDLGRVCEYGSIRVNKVCELESYQTVHHLVSEISGRLRINSDAIDLLRAAFPGGSVTGAPKVRAMQIISELEPDVRGPYCGCIGYLGFDGAMDANILIRTFIVGGGWAQFPVGAGIVADSDPRLEYDETMAKAEGLLRSLRS